MTNATNTFLDACKRAGIRATHQRVEVYRALMDTMGHHPDVEDIHRKVRMRMPTISLDTVYRTLKMFESKGIIDRVGVTSGVMRYELSNEPHHHFVCNACSEIRDVDAALLGIPALPKKLNSRFAVESIHIEIRGLCDKCAAQRPKRKARN